MLRPQIVVLDLALSLLLGCSGVGGAWLLRRRSSLSIRNLLFGATGAGKTTTARRLIAARTLA